MSYYWVTMTFFDVLFPMCCYQPEYEPVLRAGCCAAAVRGLPTRLQTALLAGGPGQGSAGLAS